jgi:hypothetical protein
MDPMDDAALGIDNPYALSGERIERFCRHGHIDLEEVPSPMAQGRYGGQITQLTIDLNIAADHCRSTAPLTLSFCR